MTGVKVARMNVMGWRLGDIEGAFLDLMMILISFPECEHSLFLDMCRGQERRIHSTELNHVLNTVSMGGTLIVSEWHLVSTYNLHCLTSHHIPHLVSKMIGTAGLGQGLLMHRCDG